MNRTARRRVHTTPPTRAQRNLYMQSTPTRLLPLIHTGPTWSRRVSSYKYHVTPCAGRLHSIAPAPCTVSDGGYRQESVSGIVRPAVRLATWGVGAPQPGRRSSRSAQHVKTLHGTCSSTWCMCTAVQGALLGSAPAADGVRLTTMAPPHRWAVDPAPRLHHRRRRRPPPPPPPPPPLADHP